MIGADELSLEVDGAVEERADELESSRAFRDAVHDILREEGLVRIASYEDPNVIWEWDGVCWSRKQLTPRRQ
jgi:hypothetical protein